MNLCHPRHLRLKNHPANLSFNSCDLLNSFNFSHSPNFLPKKSFNPDCLQEISQFLPIFAPN